MIPPLRRLTLCGIALFVAATGVSAARPADLTSGDRSPNAAIHGTWRNPYNSVDVRIDDCGPQHVCGVVVNATAEALADAKESGYPDLVGMQLMRNYRPDGPRRWTGIVFVPDMGHSFSSHIVLIDPTHARIAGCLWRQYFCQSQIWRRL